MIEAVINAAAVIRQKSDRSKLENGREIPYPLVALIRSLTFLKNSSILGRSQHGFTLPAIKKSSKREKPPFLNNRLTHMGKVQVEYCPLKFALWASGDTLACVGG